jgi:tetratricopeptide (TPR) repeat protein
MTMKRSENANYLEYMDHLARANYAAAREALNRCLNDLRAGPSDPILESDLLHRLGDLFLFEGNVPEALRHYQLSEQADPDSLLPLLFVARSLGEKLGDVPWALAKCDEVIRRATESPTEATEDYHGSEQYIARALELKAKLLSIRR